MKTPRAATGNPAGRICAMRFAQTRHGIASLVIPLDFHFASTQSAGAGWSGGRYAAATARRASRRGKIPARVTSFREGVRLPKPWNGASFRKLLESAFFLPSIHEIRRNP